MRFDKLEQKLNGQQSHYKDRGKAHQARLNLVKMKTDLRLTPGLSVRFIPVAAGTDIHFERDAQANDIFHFLFDQCQ